MAVTDRDDRLFCHERALPERRGRHRRSTRLGVSNPSTGSGCHHVVTVVVTW